MDALAELDEARTIEPDPRDVARNGLVDDRLGRRPERTLLGETDERLDLLGKVERRLVGRDEMIDESDGKAAGLASNILVAVLEYDVVPAPFAGHAARLADVRLRAGKALQLERDVLGHMAQPRSVLAGA